MGSFTVKPIKPLKLKQKTWSQVKSEREREKMASSPKMPRLDKEPICTIDSSSESENEEELPDLDDYSIICISDDELYYKSVEKLSDNRSTDTEENIKKQLRSRNYSTSTDDEDVTVVKVQIVETDSYMEDTDESYHSSPKCKRRKMSGSSSSLESKENQNNSVLDIYYSNEESELQKSKNEIKTETIKKVFDKRSQDKLTNILNQMKVEGKVNFKSGIQDKSIEKQRANTFSESKLIKIINEAGSSFSGSKSRHFMDMLTIDSDNENSNFDPPKIKKFRRKNKMRKVVRKSDEEVKSQRHINSFFSIKKDNHKKCFWQRHKSNMSSIKLESEVDSLVGAFSQVHINTVEGCWEDEQNTGFMRHGLQFLADFSNTNKPPAELIQRIIQEGIVSCKTEELMMETYDCLMSIYKKFPNILQIDFKILQDTLEHLNFGQSFSNQNSILVRKTIYILRLIILYFEEEMITRNISDPKAMRQTSGYKALSYDCSFNNVKELVNYIVYCLTNEQTFNNEIPEILPLLQRLLYISIEVSSNTIAAAKAIASELIKSYNYLPSIDHKKLLVQTLESNLLRYKLVTLVLERQCEDTVPCYDFPSSLQDIFSCFFKARPPTNISTPPTSPQSDDESMDNPSMSTAGYPAIYVEELLMLLFEVLQSYAQCNQGELLILPWFQCHVCYWYIYLIIYFTYIYLLL